MEGFIRAIAVSEITRKRSPGPTQGWLTYWWRVSSKLTLNIGLRYDYFGHPAAKDVNKSGSFLTNPDGRLDNKFNVGKFRPNDNPYESDPINFGPRLGFALQPRPQRQNRDPRRHEIHLQPSSNWQHLEPGGRGERAQTGPIQPAGGDRAWVEVPDV